MEVHIALDRPAGPELAAPLNGRTIAFDSQATTPRGALRIAAAKLDDAARTLVLVTDPHPFEGRYSLAIPALQSSDKPDPITYTLAGVEAAWTEPDAAEPSLTIWWPHFDPKVVRTITAGSVEHERAFQHLAQPGRLTLRSLVTLPEGRPVVRLRSGTIIEEAALGGEPAELTDDGHRAEVSALSDGQPIELLVTLATGEPLALEVTASPSADSPERPLSADRLTVPWSPGPPPPATTPPLVPPALTGGDPRRGEAVFFSEEARCSTCHKARGQGGEIGPDLAKLPVQDPATILRDIQDPSAVIHPDFAPYTVALKDGRVLVGVVRAEGAETLRVLDTNAQTTTVARAEVADIQPSRTSIMPVGLAGALGEARLRDLLAFLTAEEKP
jgi:putative heme-binding domain-containing protein